MKYELLISSRVEGKSFLPAVQEPVEWTTERRSTPGKLTFSVIKDEALSFHEGDAVRLKVNGENVFFGFVFTKKRQKEQIISVTAFDQLRYLKNKDTYVYENKTASQLIKMLADDFRLQTGELADTKFVIASRVEDNTSLFDMIGNALDLTLQNTKELYVLYDDFGKITLKSLADMKVGSDDEGYLMIDAETAENFDYSSSIDKDTYNKIKLCFENSETGKRDIYIAQDSEHMNWWGVLQYFDTLSKSENGKTKADSLLQLYNHVSRNLKINNAFGDTRVRAGSMVIVNLGLGDLNVKNFMLVEKCVHRFALDEHTMTLTVRGGEFVG